MFSVLFQKPRSIFFIISNVSLYSWVISQIITKRLRLGLIKSGSDWLKTQQTWSNCHVKFYTQYFELCKSNKRNCYAVRMCECKWHWRTNNVIELHPEKNELKKYIFIKVPIELIIYNIQLNTLNLSFFILLYREIPGVFTF